MKDELTRDFSLNKPGTSESLEKTQLENGAFFDLASLTDGKNGVNSMDLELTLFAERRGVDVSQVNALLDEFAYEVVTECQNRISMAQHTLWSIGGRRVKLFKKPHISRTDQNTLTCAEYEGTISTWSLAAVRNYTELVERQTRYFVTIFREYDQCLPKLEELDAKLWPLGGRIEFRRPKIKLFLPARTGFQTHEFELFGTKLACRRIEGCVEILQGMEVGKCQLENVALFEF